MATTPYNHGEIEVKVQQGWEREDAFRVQEQAEGEKVRCSAHGSRTQLHHRRRDQPLSPHVREKRAAAHGLGCFWAAGGECRYQE